MVSCYLFDFRIDLFHLSFKETDKKGGACPYSVGMTGGFASTSGSTLLIDGEKKSSPLLNCAKIGQSYFVRAINNPSLHGVCMINEPLPFTGLLISSQKAQSQSELHPETSQKQLDELIGGTREGSNPCPFYTGPSVLARKKKEGKRRRALLTAQRRTLETVRAIWAGPTEVRGPIRPCTRMNPTQGSQSQDTNQLHPKEETDTEGEEPLQPRDMTTEKGPKLPRSSLPFSVESLISKKNTCRTSCSASDSAALLPEPAAVQCARFSPRTFYAERRVSVEGSQGVSRGSGEESPPFCEKEQSTWFQASSFSTPPRKSGPPYEIEKENAHLFIICAGEVSCLATNSRILSLVLFFDCA